jgi:hypothetical protein
MRGGARARVDIGPPAAGMISDSDALDAPSSFWPPLLVCLLVSACDVVNVPVSQDLLGRNVLLSSYSETRSTSTRLPPTATTKRRGRTRSTSRR